MEAFRCFVVGALFVFVGTLTQPAFAQVEVHDDAEEADQASAGESTASLPAAESRNDFKPTRILPQIGGALSSITGEGTGDAKNRVGLHVGATADFGSSDFVIESGLLYRQLGANAGQGDSELTANYLSVPVFAKYYFQGFDETSLYVKGGLLASVLVYKEQRGGRAINDFDFGPSAGIGAKFPAGSSSEFFVEANYYRGLIQLWENGSQYNSSLALMGGFSLAL